MDLLRFDSRPAGAWTYARQQAFMSWWRGRRRRLRHSTMLPQRRVWSMRPAPPLPQMRQKLSNSGSSGAAVQVIFEFRRARIAEPFPELALTKPPLASDLDRGNFLAFSPEANRSWRYTKPFRDGSRGQ